ncbi:MAG: PQQ-like beta-propeller repeat protein, partial [Thermoplasmata archaeon]|nr:PQQ-like beta-propeller repeat protein [Thermoplasmata archaeon]
MKRKILESLFVLAVVILFIIPVVSSMSMRSFSSRDNYNIYHHQSDEQQTSWCLQYPYDESSISNGRPPAVINERSALSTGGPMNSSWPMYCHDTHHTGRSPYSTADNPPGILKWIFETHHFSLYGSTVIDSDGIIYTAANDLYAIYPNGTMKWQFALDLRGDSCPAIDSNGTIYVASAYGDHNYIYALYPNGSMKWRYYTGNDIFSSPAIGSDGTIYCGCGQSILALFPNGTLRWQHSTNHVVYSSPAIGDDGTVYCGCHDTYLYALYPNNGTVKWMFKTGDWIRVSPCIADDGTIYCVSTDGYLYAIRENGTMKWRTWVEAGTSPT